MNKKSLNWDAFNKNVENVLGEGFWNDIQQVLPKRQPNYDLYDLGEEAVLLIDLPGFTKQDQLDLTQSGNSLLLEGETSPPHPDWKEKLIHSERLNGSFKRTIPIPFPFKYDNIHANYRNGVLWVSIRKAVSSHEVSIDPTP